jgi:hypothetical protein
MAKQLTLIERESEVTFLKETLAATAADPAAKPRAIFVIGPAGRGSSSLLRLAATLAPDTKLLAGRWPGGAVGPEALRGLLPATTFTRYDSLQKQVGTLEHKVEIAQLSLGLPLPDAADDEPRLRVVQAIPPQALHFLIRRIYTTYNLEQMSEQATAFVKTGLEHIITLTAFNLNQLRTFVDELHATLTPSEWELYLRPEEELARALGQGLAARAAEKNKLFLITLDDYQPTEGSSDRWLRLVIEESGRSLWLFSANDSPGWGETLTPAPLSEQGSAAYVEAQHGRKLNQEEIDWLTNLSKGEPLTLAIAADLYAGGATTSDLDAAYSRTPNERLEGLFLYFVEESGRLSEVEQMQLYCLALLRKPTPEFMAEFRPAREKAGYTYDSDNLGQLLEKYAWLASGADLHPALKGYLRRYLMVEKRRFSQPIQEGIIEPARTAAVKRLAARESYLVNDPALKGSLFARAADAEWGERVADVAYYRFWLDEAVGWFFLLPRWLIALAYNEGLARRLLVVAEEMSHTFYTEGQEILPYIRAMLTPSFSGGRAQLDEKLAALEGLEELGTSARGRWYKAENLGTRPQSGGSPEAELRGFLKWFQGRILEETGQYERTAPLYEGVLATNVSMPELEHAAARVALYLGVRYRLKGAHESAFGSFSRAAELNGQQPEVQRALYYQAVRTSYFDVALKAADALSAMPGYETQGELFTIFALFALDRQPETQTELRTFLTNPATDLVQTRAIFRLLAKLANMSDETPGLAEILAQLPE